MALDESIAAAASLAWLGEQGGERVKSEIGRVKSWGAFSISRFAFLSFLSAELSVPGFSGRMEALV
jgi:hypothetical protein